MDVSDPKSIDKFLSKLKEKEIKIDVLVHNESVWSGEKPQVSSEKGKVPQQESKSTQQEGKYTQQEGKSTQQETGKFTQGL